MESTPVEVKNLSPNATLPTRATPNSAGLDLASAYDYVIAAKSKIIKTDRTIKIPKSCYGRIGPRSSLTLNYFIDVGVGVVGEDFTGNICIILLIFSWTNCYCTSSGSWWCLFYYKRWSWFWFKWNLKYCRGMIFRSVQSIKYMVMC